MLSCIEEIKILETLFSDNQYNGSGNEAFVIEKGTIPIMISASHAINQFKGGQVKWADVYTGGIARYLRKMTGCHLIYSCMFTETEPNYDPPGFNKYQDTLKEYLDRHEVYFLMDLHGSSKKREYAVELGTATKRDPITGVAYEEDPSLHEYKFIASMMKDVLEDNFKNCDTDRKEVWKNRIFTAGRQNSVTKFISENTSTACIQLEINGVYRDPNNKMAFETLVKSLLEIINLLSSYNWCEVNLLRDKN